MNFIDEINAFENWLEGNSLDTLEQLLWYKLFMRFNKSGWSEWITVENQDLMADIKIKREATFIVKRDNLIQAGLIEYRRGGKGNPNKYKLTSLVSKYTFKMKVQSAAESEAQSADITKQDKTRQNISLDGVAAAEANAYVKSYNGDDVFEKAYGFYPRKEGKAEGKGYYLQYLTVGREIKGYGRVRYNHIQIAIAIKEFADEMAGDNREREMIKHFATFMSKSIVEYVEKTAEEYRETMTERYGEEWEKVRFEYAYKGQKPPKKGGAAV